MGCEGMYRLTPEQKDVFKKLKNRINNDYNKDVEDNDIHRFLRARNFDLKQAETMLKNHLDWKKKNKIDTILVDFKLSEVLENYVHVNYIGPDKEGRPVVFIDIGKLDFKGVLKSMRKSELLRYLAFLLASYEKRLIEQTKKFGKTVDQWVVILDFENFPLSHAINKPVIEVLFEGLSMYEVNYPERLKNAYIINTAMVFYLVFNAVKPIFSTKTLDKIKIFGRDGWKETILEVVDPYELPAFLGGKKSDPDGDPLCHNTVLRNSPIPKHYYLKNSERRLSGQAEVKKFYLNRKGKIDITFNIIEPGSSIEWEFETESNDIAFGLFYREESNDAKLAPIIDTLRVDAHMQVETGTVLCEKPGTYVLTLDNSYSWFRQKQIFCRAAVISPSGQRAAVTS